MAFFDSKPLPVYNLADFDARIQDFTMEYDHLGRMLTRTVTDGTSIIADSWDYDFGVGNGLLAQTARAIDNVRVWERNYTYDTTFRPRNMTTEINGESFSVDMYHDPYFARPYARTYPNNGMSVYTTYDQNGYMVEEGLASQFNTNEFLHRMDRISERGQNEQMTYGNGLVQEFDHYNNSGQMLQTWLHSGGGETLTRITYAYDHFGNLSQQAETHGSVQTETFAYDHLHRLKTSARSGLPVVGTATVNYAYDALGNITSKNDYATGYQYAVTPACGLPGGPNAVKRISLINGGGNVDYGYDESGNQVCDNAGSIMTYDPYNQPTSIMKNGAWAMFDYGSDGQRYRQGGDRNVIYIDKLYERHNQTKHQYYVGDYAVVTDNGAGLEISYLHSDRLGSMIAISDEAGNVEVEEQRGFDPFGKPREGDWNDSDGVDGANTGDLDGYERTTRGFTGHEHLNGTQIIHMNGRTYDYNLGRFMSVDPIIQSPANSQSMNPYSYIMNNPLGGTDPSGYAMVDDGCGPSGCDSGTSSAEAGVEGDNASAQKVVTATTTGSRLARKVGTYTDNGDGTGTYTDSFTGRSDTVDISSGSGSPSSPTTESGKEVSSTPEMLGKPGDPPSNSGGTSSNSKSQHNGVQGCKTKAECNQILDTTNSKAGTRNKEGFDSLTDANLAAAREYGPASVVTRREVNWIAYEYTDSNGDIKYGYTHASVGRRNDQRPDEAIRRLERGSSELRKMVRFRSQGHSHFNQNLNFSGTDLLAVIGPNERSDNIQVLVDRNGEVSYISRTVLSNTKFRLNSSGAIREHALKYGNDSQINGKVLGNIYDK